MNTGYRELKVYQMAYNLAMDIYQTSKKFPVEEKYSMTDQIRRSSRSVCANFAEGYRKRQYPKVFLNKISDSDGECSETITWLDFAKDCGYLNKDKYEEYITRYNEVGKMLGSMLKNYKSFLPKST